MKSARIWVAIGLLVCLTTLFVFREPVLMRMAHWLDVGEPPRSADYVMVLPGGPEQRPFVAIAMLKAGLAKGIMTAKTQTDPSNDEGVVPTNDAVLRKTLMLRGIREDQIQILPGQSSSTWTDAMALSLFMKAHPEVTVAIVTDCYHTRRSRWVFHRVLGTDAKRVFFVSATLDTVSPNSWWKTEEGLNIYFSEYFKLILYVMTDRGTIVLVAGSLVAIVLVGFLRRRRTQRLGRSLDASATPGLSAP